MSSCLKLLPENHAALPEVPAEAYASIAAELSGTSIPNTTIPAYVPDTTLRSTIIQRSKGQRFGLSVSSVNRNIHIALVLKGSPAANAGLRVGDRLHEFNGQRLAGQDPLDLLQHMNHTSRKISLLTSSCEFMKTYHIRKDHADDRLGLRLEKCKILGTVEDTPAHALDIPGHHYLVYINNICVIGMDILRISSTLAVRGRDIKIEIMPEREYILLMVQFGSDSMARKLLDKPMTPAQTSITEHDTSIFNWNFIETFATNPTTTTDFKRSVSHFETSVALGSRHNSTPSTPVISPKQSPLSRRQNIEAGHQIPEHTLTAATKHRYTSDSTISTLAAQKTSARMHTNTHSNTYTVTDGEVDAGSASSQAHVARQPSPTTTHSPVRPSHLSRPQPFIRSAKSVNAAPVRQQSHHTNPHQNTNSRNSRNSIFSPQSRARMLATDQSHEDSSEVLFSNDGTNGNQSPSQSPQVPGKRERALRFLGLDDMVEDLVGVGSQGDGSHGDQPPPSPLEALSKKYILPLLW